jgi:hypothetical protein
MTFPALLLSSWLTLAWLPSGMLETYNGTNVKIHELNNSFYTEMGFTIKYGWFFIDGIIRVPFWKTSDSIYCWPNSLVSTIGAGLEIGILRIGWEHTCTHAVIPYAYAWYDKAIVKSWDSASDTIYATVRTEWK